MNTKIILGIEMANERQAIIESSAQDLSSDSRSIASLDKGEAIITSNFSRFAIPIKIPLYSEVIKESENNRIREKYFNNTNKNSSNIDKNSNYKIPFEDIEKEVYQKMNEAKNKSQNNKNKINYQKPITNSFSGINLR
jgi:Zn-dependent oligopeptidase